MQLVREHSVTVVSARWATVDWSLPKEWNQRARANLHEIEKGAGREWIVEHSPKILARQEKATKTIIIIIIIVIIKRAWLAQISFSSALLHTSLCLHFI